MKIRELMILFLPNVVKRLMAFSNRRSFKIILKDLFTVLILQVPVDILLLRLHFSNSSHILRQLSPLLKHRLPRVHSFQEIYRGF